MANVIYEGENVLKYNIDGPSDPLGPNENDRWCKSVNGEAPDEVELWDRNDPGPEGCCGPPLAMTSAKKSMIVDGQLQVDGVTGNPVDILENPSFGIWSKLPMVVTPGPVDFPDTADSRAEVHEGEAAFWIGTPSEAVALRMTAISDPDNSDSTLLVPATRIKRNPRINPIDSWDAGTY